MKYTIPFYMKSWSQNEYNEYDSENIKHIPNMVKTV